MKIYNYYYDGYDSQSVPCSDLATERRRAGEDERGITYEERKCSVGRVERVRITSEEGERSIMRPMGIYDTVTAERLDKLDDDALYDLQEEVARLLCVMVDEMGVMPMRILVTGLGNPRLTPDSVGPKSATRVKPTLHISRSEPHVFDVLECSEISVFCPDVSSITGMDSVDAIRAIADKLRPDLVIAIDSIMTVGIERLGCTVQLSSTGLFPGGLGNLTSPISASTIGRPVVGIGVPTVIDASRLTGSSALRGTYVSPREIDSITDNAAEVIGGAINQTFGPDM